MSKNKTLSAAKSAKNDEFYTQYSDIQKEINAYLDYDPDTFRDKTVLLPCDDPEWSNFTRFFAQNFETLGLKKLISTSYAPDAKKEKYGVLFEYAAERNGGRPKNERGKIFVLDHDTNASGRIDLDDLEWKYLEGDGDFRSEEVCKLRDEADVIVTNPPFSLFREFLAWILEGSKCCQCESVANANPNAQLEIGNIGNTGNIPKQFLIIGNMNAITYKEVFPLVMQNRLWLGASIHSGDREFGVPKEYPLEAAGWRIDEEGNHFIRVKGVRWFTNIEHGRRHQPLQLMTERENIKYSRHKEIRGVGYEKYANYDALEVPYSDAIPDDYDGTMGVPISFLDKYCPEQFEILGMSLDLATPIKDCVESDAVYEKGGLRFYLKIGDKKYHRLYDRIVIRARRTE